MWDRPWRYAEGWMIGAGLFTTGILLQWATGKVDTDVLQYPVNLMIGVVYLVFLIIFHLLGRKNKRIRWFSGFEATITASASFLFTVILMGLIRQVSPAAEVPDGGILRFGFAQMTVSWPFLLLFLYFISVLGEVTLRRISHFRWKDLPFVLNHAGLFLTLWAALLGNGDLRRLRMTVPQDTAEWRAADEQNRMVELPLAVELKSFTIDEYPPKLVIIDNETGKALPEKQPVHLSIENTPLSGTLSDWQIEVTAFLPMAACVATQDTVNFVGFQSEGATSALYVKAKNLNDGTVREGWVSSGNYMFPYVTLPLDHEKVLVMPEREPKRFASEVRVYTPDKQKREALIEVNKPFSVAGWNIYQLSYDETMGKWSRTSVFELVSDPWLPAVYTGIGMMLLGAVCLFVLAPRKKEE